MQAIRKIRFCEKRLWGYSSKQCYTIATCRAVATYNVYSCRQITVEPSSLLDKLADSKSVYIAGLCAQKQRFSFVYEETDVLIFDSKQQQQAQGNWK